MESLEADFQELDFTSAVGRAMQHAGCGVLDTSGFYTPDGKYTNLALMLSDMCPWHIEIRVAGETVRVLRGSVVKQLGDAARVAVSTRVDLAESRGVELKRMQLLVIEEALLNAVCHRDYRSDEPIVVDVEVCYIRVSSPGG